MHSCQMEVHDRVPSADPAIAKGDAGSADQQRHMSNIALWSAAEILSDNDIRTKNLASFSSTFLGHSWLSEMTQVDRALSLPISGPW